MGYGAVILPALIGYYFLTHLHYTSYRILKDTGYHVLFKSAMAGVLLAFLARWPVMWIKPLVPEWTSAWKSFAPFDFSGTIFASAVLAVPLAFLGNLVYDKHRAFERVAEEDGNGIALLISDSINYQFHIEVSLRNGKSYMGYALEIGREGGRDQSDVCLLLTASGYRSEDKRELFITTNYADLQDALSEKTDVSDYQVVFPLADIVSARHFDPAVYRVFQDERKS